MNIMELNNVEYAYDNKRKVLKGVSLSLEEGKCTLFSGRQVVAKRRCCPL